MSKRLSTYRCNWPLKSHPSEKREKRLHFKINRRPRFFSKGSDGRVVEHVKNPGQYTGGNWPLKPYPWEERGQVTCSSLYRRTRLFPMALTEGWWSMPKKPVNIQVQLAIKSYPWEKREKRSHVSKYIAGPVFFQGL